VTDDAPLVRYQRRGGRPPADDEALEIAPDGAFTARRTVGGGRVGRFAGRLDAAVVDKLSAAVDAVGAGDDLTIATPADGATEVVEAAGRTGQFGSNEKPPVPWKALVDRLRTLLDGEVLEHPVAALEVVATTRTARLGHIGTEPLDVDVASVAVRAVRLDEGGAVLGRWNGSLGPVADEDTKAAAGAAQRVTAGPGWEQELPFRHGLELAPGDVIQVWVHLRVGDGKDRNVRLFRAVPAGEGSGDS
jgi:hypothetical protein